MRRSPRVAAALLAVAGLISVACTSSSTGSSTPSGSPSEATSEPTAAPTKVTTGALAKQVCAQNSHEVLLRTWRGVMPGRSGNIQLISEFPDYVGAGLTHSSPYDYTQDVPFFFYGPGYIRPGVYPQPVTLADLAPTTGALLDFPFDAPDGEAQTQALLPARPLPRLVVTIVWDSGGMDVLERWPDSYPYLESIKGDGAWFTHASVGSSPSNTPTGHATMGTGAFPLHSGMVDEYILLNGRIQKPNAEGPAFMVTPTLADLYDRAMGNRPLVGALASLSAHIMMMSHGSQFNGGDQDIAVTREKEFASTGGDDSAISWNLTSDMAPFYGLPSYVNDLPSIEGFNAELDRLDGALDGNWRDNSIAQLHNGFDTPARTPYQTQLFEEVISREGFGSDDIPDILYLNYKAIDVIGHQFSADGIEMSDALKVQDENLETFVEFLDTTVGAGKWVIAITADHGTNRDPLESGAFQIDTAGLEEQLVQHFDDGDDVPVIVKNRTTELWLNESELAQNGYTLEDVSKFIMGLTQTQTVKSGRTPQPGHEDDTVFSGAFPSTMLSQLPCLPEARRG